MPSCRYFLLSEVHLVNALDWARSAILGKRLLTSARQIVQIVCQFGSDVNSWILFHSHQTQRGSRDLARALPQCGQWSGNLADEVGPQKRSYGSRPFGHANASDVIEFARFFERHVRHFHGR